MDGLGLMYPEDYGYTFPMTPLMTCIREGGNVTQKAVEKLLKAGANPDVKTKDKGRTVTAIQLAKDKGKHQVRT